MEFQDQNEQKTSKYNAAFDQLYRISELWRNAHKAAMGGNYDQWNKALDEVWKELAGDLKPKDEAIGDFLNYNIKLSKFFPLATPNHFGFNKPSASYKDAVSNQYNILTAKEIFLRRLQNQLGKGTAYLDEGEDDFE